MSFFFKDKDKAKDVTPTKSNPQSISSFVGFNTTSSVTESVGDVDFNSFLKDVIKKANLPGPDYYEFMEAVAGLNGMPLTEVQKMQTAFAILNKQGLTVAILVDSASTYITKLNEAKENIFQREVKQAENLIASKEKSFSDLTAENEKLAQQMQNNTIKMSDVSNEVNTLKNKLTARKSSFEHVFNNTIQVMQNDIINIKTNIHENAIVQS